MKKISAIIASVALASGAALAGDDVKNERTFDDVDSNADGRITEAEISTNPADTIAATHFTHADVDENGYLSTEEYDDLLANLRDADSEEEAE